MESKFLRCDGQWVVPSINFNVEYEVNFEAKKLPEPSLMDDLEYFQRKVWTSLAVPAWYLMNSENSDPAPEFKTVVPAEYLSKRFVQKHYLGLTDEEIKRMFQAERDWHNYDQAMKAVGL